MRYLTILPRHKSSKKFKFASAHFAAAPPVAAADTLRPNGAGAITELSTSGCSSNYQCVDEEVSDEAARYIREEAPDLSWIYLQYTDDAGHQYGDSEFFNESVQMADKQVGKIWEAIKSRGDHNEKWMICITTDHGRDAQTGKDHGGP